MHQFPFTKMHGLGNCFVLMDDRDNQVSSQTSLSELAISACNRNYGMGADGLILLKRGTTNPLRMRIFNEDGSEAEMCGNGIRCLTRFAVDQGILSSREMAQETRIDTLAGVIKVQSLPSGEVKVDMGRPTLNNADVQSPDDAQPPIQVRAENRLFTFVSMGNPHAITLVDDFDFDWRAVGAKVEHSPVFPNRTNVEFVKIISRTQVEVKVWERGCGETLACGTGACAVAVAGVLTGKLDKVPVAVVLPGGPLTIHWQESGTVLMTGPAATICTGFFTP